jgi:cellulose biosynthesis protein BcsQ
LGVRGGVGVTFVASHLAAAFARAGSRTALVDMDPAFGDLTAALGLVEDDHIASIEDLVPVMDELDPDHVERALTRHQGGFDVLLSRPSMPHPAPEDPSDPPGTPIIPSGLYGACVALLAHDHDAVVVQVPRTLGSLTKSAVRLADETIVVSGADLMSLYGSRRMLAFLRQEAHGTNVRIVLNITRRPEATAAEVERVLGSKPAARIRLDPAVAVAQATGRLVRPRGGRAWPEVARLAAMLLHREPEAGAPR